MRTAKFARQNQRSDTAPKAGFQRYLIGLILTKPTQFLCFPIRNRRLMLQIFKNPILYLSDPEKQKVLRYAMQRPAHYLNEFEACMEQILSETIEEAEKTA